MISILFDSQDFFSQIGLKHFIERSGLAAVLNIQSGSGIVIIYGDTAGADTGQVTIRLKENEIKDTICGTVVGSSGLIPVCQIPYDTGAGGEVIAFFKTGDTQYPCITRKEAAYWIGIDIFRETGHLLSGHLDIIRSSLDRKIQNEIAIRPIVDLLEDTLFEIIRSAFYSMKMPLVQKSFWPDGRPFAVCLTHDVDELKKTYQWISRPLRFLVKKDLYGFKSQILSFIQKMQGSEPYDTYEDIIRIEHDLEAKSTYFILKESGNAHLFYRKSWYLYGRNRSFQTQEMRSLIQKLKANGDEIAIHGSFYSYTDPELLNKETRELEQISGESVIGTRQHNLNLDIPRTWESQFKAGLTYDTSLGFNDRIGFRWGTSFPFHPNNGQANLQILEIPLIIMDICVESSKNKDQECIHIADEVEKTQGVLTLLWHPPIFNPYENHDARNLYIRINRYCRDKGAWITRAKDIAEWLIARNKNTYTCSYSESAVIISPQQSDTDLFFTVYLPTDNSCQSISKNARILKQDRDCIIIKSHDLQKNDEIIVGIA